MIEGPPDPALRELAREPLPRADARTQRATRDRTIAHLRTLQARKVAQRELSSRFARALAVALVALAGAGAVWMQLAAWQTPPPERLFQQAIDASRAGDAAGALGALTELMDRYPDSPLSQRAETEVFRALRGLDGRGADRPGSPEAPGGVVAEDEAEMPAPQDPSVEEP